MAKIYSVIDAHEAEQFIGQEGYFGDCLSTVKDRQAIRVLKRVNVPKRTYRFEDESGRTWSLFQPIEKTDLEIAKGLLGKVMKSKVSKAHIVFTELEDFPELGIMLRSITRQYALKDVLEMFVLEEDQIDRVINKTVWYDEDRPEKGYVKIKYNVDGKRNLSLVGCYGQNREDLLETTKPKEPYTLDMLKRLYVIWNTWHLNDMHSGCIHQDNWDKQKPVVLHEYWRGDAYISLKEEILSGGLSPEQYKESSSLLQRLDTFIGSRNYNAPEDLTEEQRLWLKDRFIYVIKTRQEVAGWVRFDEHKEGLLLKPCEVCGYKYGSSWSRREIPVDVIEFLDSL